MNIDKSVKILPGAYVLGDVELGKNVSIWYNAVIRSDIETISVGNNSNIQDNCVLHTSNDHPVKIGEYVSIGHNAVIHGCEIDDNVIVGMSATILNGAKIGKDSIVGAGSLVTKNKEFPPKSLIMGLPAKAIRELTNEEIQSIRDNAEEYLELSKDK